MDNTEFIRKVDKANEELIKSNNLSQETKSLGDKLMLASVVLLLWSFRLIEFSNNTIEFSGINIKFEQDVILNIILLAVTIYFFVHFILEVKAEWASRKNVIEVIDMNNELFSESNERQKKINELQKKENELMNKRLKTEKMSREEWITLCNNDGLKEIQDELFKLVFDKKTINKLQDWGKILKRAVKIKKFRILLQMVSPIIFAIIAIGFCIAAFFYPIELI